MQAPALIFINGECQFIGNVYGGWYFAHMAEIYQCTMPGLTFYLFMQIKSWPAFGSIIYPRYLFNGIDWDDPR